MNILKKFFGVVWIAMALFAGYYLLEEQSLPKFKTGKTEDLIPAIIYTFILLPIIVGGLGVFGWYSLQGEYSDDKL